MHFGVDVLTLNLYKSSESECIAVDCFDSAFHPITGVIGDLGEEIFCLKCTLSSEMAIDLKIYDSCIAYSGSVLF